MTFAPFGALDLKPVYQHLKLLELSEICQLETGKFEYKSQKGLLPVQIGNYFEDSSTQEIRHSYGLRSRSRNDAPP